MNGKAIFITGGGSGIGRAMAVLFGARGWTVGLADINEAGMAETSALITDAPVHSYRLDVRDREQWDKVLAAFAEAAGGRIDVLANNAGIAFGGPLIQLSQKEIDALVDINIRGVIYGAQAAQPWLAKSAPGSCLLNTASASALYGTPNMAVYSAGKFAVRGLTEALDVEWARYGIKVRSLMPGYIDTPLLAHQSNAKTKGTMREKVLSTGMEFTPVGEVAEAAWNAVHSERVHWIVGKTARKLAFLARWAPGHLRNKMRGGNGRRS